MLDLKPLISDERVAGAALPGGQKIFFEVAKTPIVPTQIIVKVRNRIGRLQEAILRRSATAPAKPRNERGDEKEIPAFHPGTGSSYDFLPPERVSALSEQSWGDEFAVSDPDGNKLIFVQPKRRSGSRL